MFNSSSRNLNLLIDKLFDILRESGFSTEDIIKDARIDLSKPIPEIDLPRIFDYAYNYTKDEALMIKLGQRVDVTYFGSFGFALMSCSDFTEAVKLLNRYHSLLGSGINFNVLLDSHNSKHTLRVSISILNNLQKKLLTELIISQAIYLLKIITNNDQLKFKIGFQHKGVKNKELYESILKCNVEFNQLHNEISIPIDLRKEKLVSANSAVHIIFEEQCEKLLRDLNKVENFSAAARRILLQAGDDLPDSLDLQRRVDAEIWGALEKVGGFSKDMITRLKYRKLLKVCLSRRKEDLSRNQIDALISIVKDPQTRREMEDDLAARAGLSPGYVAIDVPSIKILLSEPRMSQVDVRVMGDDGKIRWLREVTPMAEALRKRQVSQEAVYVMTLPGNEARVADIAERRLFS